MANIKQQKKRIGTAQRQRMQNLRYRSTIKTLFNRLQLAVDTGDRTTAESTHLELVKLLDRAVTRGALHRNTASRKKARAARVLLQEAKTDTATARRAKKKTTPARKPKAAAKPKAEKAVTAPVVEEPETADEPVATEAAAPEAEIEAAAGDENGAEGATEVTPAEEAPADEAPAEAADEADAEAPKE